MDNYPMTFTPNIINMISGTLNIVFVPDEKPIITRHKAIKGI